MTPVPCVLKVKLDNLWGEATNFHAIPTTVEGRSLVRIQSPWTIIIQTVKKTKMEKREVDSGPLARLL